MHPKLNLPLFPIKTDTANTSIFCLSRKKYIVLTPEEWVRQHFLNLLISHLDYPKGMIRLEQSIQYFNNKKRSDIAVVSPKGDCFMLVECKSYTVDLNEKTLKQIAEYHKILKANYLTITNGMNHFIWKYEDEKFTALSEFPTYPEVLKQKP